jgi:hypothetical protein
MDSPISVQPMSSQVAQKKESAFTLRQNSVFRPPTEKPSNTPKKQ